MKKLILLMNLILTTIDTFAIDPSGARIDYGESGMNIPTPLLIFGLIIATIACLFMGNMKDKNGNRDFGMLFLGILGVIGIVFVLSSIG